MSKTVGADLLDGLIADEVQIPLALHWSLWCETGVHSDFRFLGNLGLEKELHG